MLIRTYIYFKEDMEFDENGVNITTREVDIYFDSPPDMFSIIEYYVKEYDPYLIQCTDFSGDVLLCRGSRYKFFNTKVRPV